MRQKMVDMVHRIQDEICDALREIDGVDFRQDEWTREEGGGGRSRVFSGGEVFEKAGVNVSVVHGTSALRLLLVRGEDTNCKVKTWISLLQVLV